MKKNNKGFTLIELLCVIALLGVVLTIAAVSISSISSAVRERQRENLIGEIKVAANKYFVNTGLSRVYVDTLITEGYLVADNEEKKVYDPVNNEPLNCYYFSSTGEEMEFIKGNCELDSVENMALVIKYCIGDACIPDQNLEGKWLNSEKITLGTNEMENAIYSWTTPLAPDLVFSDKHYDVKIPSDGYIDGIYRVRVKSNGKEYQASASLKVDTKNPTVDSITVNDPDTYTNDKKTLTIALTDNESGLEGYAVTNGVVEPTSWVSIDGYNLTVAYPIAENGTYYVWVKDKAGNTNLSNIQNNPSDNSIVITKIDKTPPTCTLSGENTVWTRNSLTLTWGCEDKESGCASGYTGGSQYYSQTAKTTKLNSYVIRDNAQNETICNEKTANLYIDKTKPSISQFTISSTKNYNSKNVTLKIKASDTNSGVDKMCFTSNFSSATCDWIKYSTNGISYTFDADEGSGKRFILYAYVKDSAGNISSLKSSSYTLYKSCTKTTSTGTEKSYGVCSKTCGGGTKCRDIYYEDTYLKTKCPTDVDGDCVECNIEKCCSEGTWAYSSCNSSGYKVESRYNECAGKTETRTTTATCNSSYTNCSWGECQSDRYKYKTCDYYNGGQKYTNTKVDKASCIYICDYEFDELFGDYKGDISYEIGNVTYKNYGSRVNMSSVSSNWCRASGGPCKPSCGYQIKCASSKCGSALGLTNAQIDTKYGCSFGSSKWCSCNTDWCGDW